ncbi:MAG: hypothetical protein ACJ74U_10880 [Jatrophihabitantaceae bacterium]
MVAVLIVIVIISAVMIITSIVGRITGHVDNAITGWFRRRRNR